MDLVRIERGQLVLVAAAVVALALLPMLFAYLQLGYHPDTSDTTPDITGDEAVEFLDRSVHDASAATAGDYEWAERSSMAEAVRAELRDDIGTLETTRIDEGIAYSVAYNTTLAARSANNNCDSGDGRQFGPCEADGGIIMQERANEAVLLSVALDIRVLGPEGDTDLTVLVTVGETRRQ